MLFRTLLHPSLQQQIFFVFSTSDTMSILACNNTFTYFARKSIFSVLRLFHTFFEYFHEKNVRNAYENHIVKWQKQQKTWAVYRCVAYSGEGEAYPFVRPRFCRKGTINVSDELDMSYRGGRGRKAQTLWQGQVYYRVIFVWFVVRPLIFLVNVTFA